MRLSLSLFVLGLCSVSAEPGVNPNLLRHRWTASWIAHAEGPFRDFGVFHFRKAFELPAKPERFVIHVSADNRYRLFVNGTFVSAGPARSDLDHYRYETVDIAPQLRTGRNVLAAVVWNFGIYAPMAQHSERAAFLVQGDGEPERVVNTGGGNSGWKTFLNAAYQPIQIPREAVPYFYVVGPGERVDGARYPWDWEQPDFDDSAWKTPARAGGAQPMELFHWNDSRWLLTPRPIPQMEETPERLAKVVRSEGVTAGTGFVQGKSPVTIPPKTRAVVLLDQAHLTTAYPELVVDGGKGAEIKVTFAESLRNEKGLKGNRDQTEGKKIRSNYDIFIADGSKRVYRTLFWRTYRYVQLDIATAEAPLTLVDFLGDFSSYPVERQARFESPDKRLEKILEVGWRTHRLCQNETYFDTPQYEQLAYAGDGRLQALITLANMWDDRIVRNHIEQFWYSARPEGMIQDRYPSREPQYIPSYGLDWIRTLYDFHMHRNDPAFLTRFLPVARNIIEWYERRLDGKGLLRRLSWTDEQYEGPQEFSENGPEARNQIEFILALKEAAELEYAIGSRNVASHYRSLIPRLKQAALDAFWVPDRGLLARNRDRKDFDEHSNVLGILADVIPAEKQRAALEYTIAHWNELPRVRQAKSSFFFFYFRHEAMEKVGMADRFMEMMTPWQKQIDFGFTTFGESADVEPRSDSHAWSCAPNVQAFSLLAGIRPAAPGYRAVSIRPHLSGLPWLRATAPHPDGEISVSLKARTGGGLEAEVTLPAGIGGWFEWGNRKVALRGGKQNLTF